MTFNLPIRPLFRLALGLAVATQATPILPAYAGAASYRAESRIGTNTTPSNICGAGMHGDGGYGDGGHGDGDHSDGDHSHGSTLEVNHDVTINKPITIEHNMNVEKNVNYQNNVNIQKNITYNHDISIEKNIDASRHIDASKQITINKSIVINKGSNNSAFASAMASAFVDANINGDVSGFSYGFGVDAATVAPYVGGDLPQALNVEVAGEQARAACVMQWATVVKSVHAICIDATGREHPAVRMRPETLIDSSLSSEIFRCLEGSRLRVSVGDMMQTSEGLSAISLAGQPLECRAGEALRHFKDGLVKCATKETVPDCTERTNLRRWGSGDMFFTYVTKVCSRAVATETASIAATSSASYSRRSDGQIDAQSGGERIANEAAPHTPTEVTVDQSLSSAREGVHSYGNHSDQNGNRYAAYGSFRRIN